jgi:hypothetical protein
MGCEIPVYSVLFESGITEELLLTPLGSGRYRLEQSALVDDSVNFGDVIAAEPASDGAIRFLNVVDKSPYVTLRWVLSERASESLGLPTFLARVIEIGGVWERATGGVLILHIPRDCAFDADGEFTRHIALHPSV